MPEFTHLPIRTERLLLRPLRGDDAPALFGIFSDTRVARHLSHAAWTAMAQAHARIERATQEAAEGRHLLVGIELAGPGTLLGTCSLFGLHTESRRAEVGYALGSAAWGQGYMQEALAGLLAYAFGPLDLNRIEADIDPRNEASARQLERQGFVKEGHLRERWIVNGEVSDTVLYGLLRSEWGARCSAP